MESGVLCETPNCGRSAKVFSLSGTLKTTSCEIHIPSLLLKGATEFFDISAYHFISTLQDSVLFNERKTMKYRGCAHLTVLEAKCEYELESALKAIQRSQEGVIRAVESRFEEIKAAARAACDEAKQQLAQLHTEYVKFLMSKDCALSPTAELLCSDLSVVPAILRFGLADSADSVSAILSDSWIVCTSDIHSISRFSDTTKNMQKSKKP